MDRSLGLGYAWGSTILLSGLIASLAIWYAREGSLRVYPIVRREVELLFWLTVLLSNSLGTAFGDFLVDVVGLTFLQGALVTAGVIAAVGAAHYFTRLNDVALFWTAFIFTRPFGATFGSALGQTRKIRASPPHVRFAPFSRRMLRRVLNSELGQKRTSITTQKFSP